MRTTLFAAALAVTGLTAASHAAIVFSDDFETGNMNKWTATAATPSPLVIDNTKNVQPAGGTYSALAASSANRMHANLGTELSGPSTFSYFLYDDGTTSSTGTGSGRTFMEVRGYAGGSGLPNGGTTASGSLGQLIAMGKYNTVTLAGDTYTATKYQGRLFIGGAGLWFNLDGAGSPNRSVGWHEFTVERLADNTTYNFYVDGSLSRTLTGDNQTWDTVVLGPGLGSQLGNVWFDGVKVTDTLVPEPASLSLLGMGALGLMARRRSR